MVTELASTVESETSGIPETSWMSYVLKNAPLVDAEGRSIPRDVLISGGFGHPVVKTKVVVLDIGNDAAKSGSIDDWIKRFQYARIPTSYKPSTKISHGEGVTSWRIVGDLSKETYWIERGS